MSSDELNQDELDNDAANKEMLLEIFYKTKGNPILHLETPFKI